MFAKVIPQTKKVSLRDVARLAGVSPATVSRILNGHENVSGETKAKTLQAIASLGYERKLRLSRFFKELHNGTQTVGYLAGSSMRHAMLASDGFYSRFLLSISRELTANKLHLLFGDALTDLTPDGQLRCVVEGKVDGLILEAFQPDLSHILSHTQINVPTVFLNVEIDQPQTDIVIPAVEKTASEQVEYLHARGHRLIACFRSRPGQTWQDRRYWQGFHFACERLGIGECNNLPAPQPFEQGGHGRAVREFLQRLLNLPVKPTAIVTYDGYANEFFVACHELGLQIPNDISLVGHDDRTAYLAGLPIGLTTYRLDMETMGSAAVSLLVERIKNPALPSRLLQVTGKIIERASVRALSR